jgi:hypothetical protein
MIEQIPLSLEQAVAMAPSVPSTTIFTASTAAIAWGAVRSGQSIWEYIIGMTQEFEAKLQAEYEAWKAENAWYRNPPVTPASDVEHTAAIPAPADGIEPRVPADEVETSVVAANAPVAPAESEACAAESTTVTDMEAPAPSEEAIAIAVPDEMPAATDEAPATENETITADESPATTDEVSVPASEAKMRRTRSKAPQAAKKAAKKSVVEEAKPDQTADLIANLPHDADSTVYSSILSGRDREELINALETFIEKRKRIHRPRSAQIAFLKWLNETAL